MSWGNVFRPRPIQRSGYQPNIVDSGGIGLGGNPVVASSTASVQVPISATKVAVLNALINWLTAAVGSAAITVQLFKVSAAGVSTALTAATSIKNDILTGPHGILLPITVTNIDGSGVVIDGTVGDTLRVDVVAAGTVTTQPQATVAVEVAIIA